MRKTQNCCTSRTWWNPNGFTHNRHPGLDSESQPCSLRPWRVLAAQAGPREGFFTIPTLFIRERVGCSLRPWREKSLSRSVLMRDGTGRMRGYKNCHAELVSASAHCSPRPLRERMPGGQVRGYQLGFTLIEILVVVLIIGILGAIMLPQYQRAVLKSRYAALMPIAKSMANSNEAYYLEHGEYADNAEDLPVQGRRNYPDGTELEFGTMTGYSYVLATRGNAFPNNYVVYQKHSEQFPGEIHCEAATDNTQAQEVCKSFGATEDIGETLTSGYLTYVLFGTGNGVAPIPCPDGATCDNSGNIIACPSGQTLNNGSCEDCATAFPHAATCSMTAYQITSCDEGYNLDDGACVEMLACEGEAPTRKETCPSGCGRVTVTANCNTKTGEWDYSNADRSSCPTKPNDQIADCSSFYIAGKQTRAAVCNASGTDWEFTGSWNIGACQVDPQIAAAAQALADQTCGYQSGCVGIANEDGTVTSCVKQNGEIQDGRCIGVVAGHYASIYDTNGRQIQSANCDTLDSGHCYQMRLTSYSYKAGTRQTEQVQLRTCANNEIINVDLTCPSGRYGNSNWDSGYSNDKRTSTNSCSSDFIDVNGVCTAYSYMTEYRHSGTLQSSRNCTKINTQTRTTCDTWGTWSAYR